MERFSGHAVQHQIVFPAAGYLSLALEASRLVVSQKEKNKNIRSIEISDFVIHQAVVFEQDDAGIEVLIEMADIEICRDQQGASVNVLRARFTYLATLNTYANNLVLAAYRDIRIFV
jgi:hypothetical protein